MKKLLRNFSCNEAGSMFVYLFYLATLVILITLTLLTQIKNEQKITQFELEQLQLNMVHQQTYQRLMNNWETIDQTEQIYYSFPNGEAKVTFHHEDPDYLEVTITATRKPPHQKIKTYALNKD